jgi:hypothetical protein
MVAQVYSLAKLNNNIKYLSDVHNSFGGYVISSGAAYSWRVPFLADKLEWFNQTKFATGSGGTNAQGVWFRDMAAASGLIISIAPITVLEAVNGVTDASTAGGFADKHLAITGITTGSPAVVTSALHGLTDGMRVYISKVIGTMAGEVNNKEFVVGLSLANTFALYDHFGNAVTTAGAYGSSGQITIEGPKLGIVNVAPSYIYTMGTAIMGAAADVIHLRAEQYNSYFNFGTAP